MNPHARRRQSLKLVRLPISPLRRGIEMLPRFSREPRGHVKRNASATTVKSQIVANTVVMRLRFRSAAADPSAAPLAPPNMSERPPPCPEWSRTPTMREIIETTLITTVMYMTMERTVIDPIASNGAITYGDSSRKGEMTRNRPPRLIKSKWGFLGCTQVSSQPATSPESTT